MSSNAPVLEDPTNEFSLSELWVMNDYITDNTLNSAEVRWTIYPSLHGDSLPHLMVYWISPISTAPLDATIDLTCSTFIQTTNKWVLDQSLPSYTTLGEWANYENDNLVTVIFHSALPGWWLYLGGNAIQNDVDVTLSDCERIIALLTG